ncbi:hypothetical protein JMJ55_14630 [Belnapia sp. T6]|uniref:Uncharacterized protein n=1 Tax=Belnapia mucosa TaxID=2804532 RepID=A0ABS1V4P6_9PROT|nr:hypothetical protein [Belnapia mucosa]MBL6456567.1 hypothetical protein [Belnapia mucosa]
MRAVLALILLAGCAVQRLEADKDLLARGETARLAAEAPPCAGPAPECRQAQEIRAAACRRQGDLPCAVAAWQAALAPDSPRRIPLNLAAAAQDAITAGAGDPAANAAAELAAAEALRRGAPADPEGCAHAGSARLALALLEPPGRGRCAILAALPPECRSAAPAPGRALQSRQLAAALAAQRRSCP